ncbi:MAG: spermidine synthase [Nitrospinaceae bacterium]|nr:MAG: spermidine synthase [Nitrospinaceae bacterium]
MGQFLQVHRSVSFMNSYRNPFLSAIPTLCLFISGAASLVYELVWIRQLTLIFGGTLFAISAVLCAFMIGLALGSWGIVRFLNRQKQHGKAVHPILMYGILEGLIGLYGLGFPLGLKLLEKVYPLALAWAVESGPFLHLIEFSLSTLLMLPPTLMMGATLPLIGSWSIGEKPQRIFSRMSLLYSLNTFGAVFGCLYTQLFAIEYFGIQGTVWTAVAMNTFVLLLCLAYREKPEETQEPPQPSKKSRREKIIDDEPAPSRTLSLLLLFIFIYSGMVSLSSEILWTRVLVFPMGSTLYSFALILATFLFSIALGSLIAEKLLGNSKWILKFLLIELGIGILGIGILPLLEQIPEWTAWADRQFYDLENTAGRTLFIRSLFAFALMLPPTLGFGILFPLANRIHLSLFGTVTGTLGNSYAFNTMGAVLGTVLTPFVFIPLFGIRFSLFAIFALLILLSAVALALYQGGRPVRYALTLSLSALVVYAGYSWSQPTVSTQRLGEHNLARTEINADKEQMRLLDYKEGDFTTLSVVEDVTSGARTLYVNGFSTATVSESIGGSAYMQAMGFVPMALHPNPKRALVVCFGTGNTLGTVSLFPGVEVDGVEIDRNVLSFAKWFSRWNHDVLERPNTRIIVQDGRTFTRWTESQYDVITLEPMSPVQAGVVNLYSKEFYEEALDRLNPDGLMMQWLPLHLIGPEDARAIIKTFQEVYPHTSVWNSFLTRIVLLVGSRQPITLDKNRFDALMRVPALAESAGQMGVRSFLDLTDFFVTDGDRLKPLLKDSPVITDNHPLLEFSPVTLLPPLKWQTDESFLNLLRYRADQRPPVTGLNTLEKDRLERDFEIRTAQRFSVFARRYHGPGEEAFAMKNYPAGLEAIRIYLDANKDAPISLQGAEWKD